MFRRLATLIAMRSAEGVTATELTDNDALENGRRRIGKRLDPANPSAVIRKNLYDTWRRLYRNDFGLAASEDRPCLAPGLRFKPVEEDCCARHYVVDPKDEVDVTAGLDRRLRKRERPNGTSRNRHCGVSGLRGLDEHLRNRISRITMRHGHRGDPCVLGETFHRPVAGCRRPVILDEKERRYENQVRQVGHHDDREPASDVRSRTHRGFTVVAVYDLRPHGNLRDRRRSQTVATVETDSLRI